MLVVSLLLLTVWFGTLVIGSPVNGWIHVLGITAVLIVFFHRSPRDRRLASGGHESRPKRRPTARPALATRTH